MRHSDREPLTPKLTRDPSFILLGLMKNDIVVGDDDICYRIARK